MNYSWTFSTKKERWKMWYIIAFSILIGAVIWGFLTQQYWMSVVFLLLAGLIFYIENNSSDEILVEINETGIRVGESFYDYSKIQSYSLIHHWEQALFLRLHLSKKWIALLDLHIDNTVAWDLKKILPEFITENEQGDLNMTDKIIKFLKL